MSKKELYYEKIILNEDYSIQIDDKDNDYINIYKNNEVIDRFKLNRKIYTLFKVIQDYTDDEDYVIVEDTNIKVYGKPIYLYDNVYMQINPDHACLTVDFYRLKEGEMKLVFLIKLIYTTQRFFHLLLVPKKLEEDDNYYITNVFKFLDMIELMQYENAE